MPFYDHECKECGHIWEDFYSMVTDPPDKCPECGFISKKHRVPINHIEVRAPLTGRDLKTKLTAERRQLREKLNKDEKLRANIAGEDRYQNSEVSRKELGENLKNI